MKVSIIGLGYIGLPTSVLIASKGVNVLGIDINQDIVNKVNQASLHFYEPDLEKLIKSVIDSGKFNASTTPEASDVFVITVPTPITDEKKSDLSYVISAIESIAPVLEKGNLVILESTSPVGLTENCVEILAKLRPDLIFPEYFQTSGAEDVFVAYSPERVLPGKILQELVQNDRVIGGISEKSAKKAKSFYDLFVKGECFLTNSRTAELCKLTENSFRDVNIAFANELSLLAEHHAIDVWELIELANCHPRVDILKPGPGVGGHCIAVDPWFIVESAPDQAKIIKQARIVNDQKPDFILNKVLEATELLRKDNSDISVASLGLSFKPNIDDLRESPAVEIAQTINSMGFRHQYLVEPNISNLPDLLISNTSSLEGLENSISNADIVLILVDHKEFKNIDGNTLIKKIVIDTVGLLRN